MYRQAGAAHITRARVRVKGTGTVRVGGRGIIQQLSCSKKFCICLSVGGRGTRCSTRGGPQPAGGRRISRAVVHRLPALDWLGEPPARVSPGRGTRG